MSQTHTFLGKDRVFYRTAARLAIPIVLQNLLVNAVSVTDNMMVGRLGEDALSGVTLANQVYFIFSLFIFGVASASTVMAAQYWGCRDTLTIQRVYWLAISSVVFFGAVFTVGCCACPDTLMRIFTSDPDSIATGADYLRRIAVANIPVAFTTVMICSLRAVEQVTLALWISSVAFLSNVFLNWVFIFGNLGAPAMGTNGAAIATALSRLIQFAILLVYLVFFEKKVPLRFGASLRIPKVLARDFFRQMVPILGSESLWGIGTSLFVAVIGRLGPESVSAYSVITTLQNVMTVGAIGLGNAVSVMIGKQLGNDRYEEAYGTARTFCILGVTLGVLCAAVTMLIRPLYLSFYTLQPQTLDLVNLMMWILMVHIVAATINFVIIVGILRGGGDARFGMMIDVGFMWPVGLPLALLFAFVFHWPVWAIYAIIVFDECQKLVFGSLRVRSGKWRSNLTRKFDENTLPND